MLLTEKEMEIYGNLYDITSKNYDPDYGKLQGNRSAFLTSVNLESFRSDLSVLENVPTDEFLEAAYIAIVRRFLDSPAEQMWKEKRGTLKEDTYKELITGSLMNSRERLLKGITAYYNIFSVPARQSDTIAAAQPMSAGITRLYRFYQKLPAWMRKIIKKVMKVR